jgi:ornithine cyclodeaminase
MLILTKKDIQNIFTMQDAIQASKEALAMHSAGKTIAPLRMHMAIPQQNATGLFMPSYAEQLDAMGIKIVSIFPNNSQLNKSTVLASMILMSGQTGEVIAIIDGTYLTELRTGALAGAATDLLATKHAKIAALFGTGAQANKQLEALLTVRDLDEVRVCGTDYEKTQKFVAAMQTEFSKFKTKLIAVKDSNQAIHDADIITAVTNSKTPVFDGQCVKKGAHINSVGSYTPEMQELPESIIHPANKIYFDTHEGVFNEAGDFLIPLKNKTITENDFSGELGKVILGDLEGRSSDQQITVFKSVGAAILDLVTAFRIYEKAVELGVGVRVEM